MKIECNAIRDLLPLYADGTVNKLTSEDIKAHLEECPSCREEYEKMKNRLVFPNRKEENDVARHAKRPKRRRLTVILLCVLILLFAVLTATSYAKFGTANFLRSGAGCFQVMFRGKEYKVIRDNPKIILAKPENAWESFMTYMEKEDYSFSESERLGGFCVFYKDGNKVTVLFSTNRFYSKWSWIETDR